jgi:hypothetical protein
MYKDELNQIHDEVDDCLVILENKAPHCVSDAINAINKACSDSAGNFLYIESLEDTATVTKKEHPHEVQQTRGKKCGKRHQTLSDEDYDLIWSYCDDISDYKKRVYAFVDKCALFAAKKAFDDSVVATIQNPDIRDNKDNVLVFKHSETNREVHVKVLASGMKFAGKTKEYREHGDLIDPELKPVPLQHTYLIDPKEPVKDYYIFVDVNQSEKTYRVHARIRGSQIHKMLFDPLRDRFVGKKACILQKEGYNKGSESPFAIDELLKRR